MIGEIVELILLIVFYKYLKNCKKPPNNQEIFTQKQVLHDMRENQGHRRCVP
jgi:hypothetical protein